MTVICSSHAAPGSATGNAGIPDPLQEQTAEVFVDQLAVDRVPSIRAQLHVGQPGRSDCDTTWLQGGRTVPLREQLAGEAFKLVAVAREGGCSARVSTCYGYLKRMVCDISRISITGRSALLLWRLRCGTENNLARPAGMLLLLL
jgi:hypothetical protein